jgi:hypothetical protein
VSWVRRADDVHECKPPTRLAVTQLPTGPVAAPTGWMEARLPGVVLVDGRLGELWRCDDCGRLWCVGRACDVRYQNVGQHRDGLKWRPATWWQRIRHRRPA